MRYHAVVKVEMRGRAVICVRNECHHHMQRLVVIVPPVSLE